MLITKKINNNVAMAQDADGNELVVFGKGIGFHSIPYELEDISVIQRTFHHVSDDLLRTIASISTEIVGVALDSVKLAENELGCKLNPNLYLTLADHLQFSAERFSNGVVIENPLAGEIPFVYPAEYELGKKSLKIMEDVTGVSLPESEACAIALHLVNAQTDGGAFSNNMSDVMRGLSIIEDVTKLVEERLGVEIDRSSHNYMRFVAHLRYLIKRMDAHDIAGSHDTMMLERLAHDFPRAYTCAKTVERYFRVKHEWLLSSEETLYLMLYIQRLDPGERDFDSPPPPLSSL